MPFICYLPLLAYIIGTFPTGLIISKLHGVDVTKQGSGNIGATNIARTLGKKAGLITLLFDALKGYFAVLLASSLTDNTNIYFLCGMMAVLGHCFSVPKILKGGKGVATSIGVLLSLDPLAGAGDFAVFIVTFLFSRYVSLSSIMGSLSAPIIFHLTGNEKDSTLIIGLIALTVIIKHHENIERLVKGEEKRFATERSD